MRLVDCACVLCISLCAGAPSSCWVRVDGCMRVPRQAPLCLSSAGISPLGCLDLTTPHVVHSAFHQPSRDRSIRQWTGESRSSRRRQQMNWSALRQRLQAQLPALTAPFAYFYVYAFCRLAARWTTGPSRPTCEQAGCTFLRPLHTQPRMLIRHAASPACMAKSWRASSVAHRFSSHCPSLHSHRHSSSSTWLLKKRTSTPARVEQPSCPSKRGDVPHSIEWTCHLSHLVPPMCHGPSHGAAAARAGGTS